MSKAQREQIEGFDLRVHIRDSKTGKIVRENPYSLSISKEHGVIYTRDGVQFNPDGTRKKALVAPAPNKDGK